MTSTLLCGDAMLRLPSARVARQDVVVLRSSAELLEQAKANRDSMADAKERAVEEGRAAGREEALAEMRAALADALAGMERDMATESARREDAAAHAAMRAVERLIGAREDIEIVTGLVRETLRQSGASGAIVVVAPDMAGPVRAALGDDADTQVESDPALPPLACRIVGGEGHVIADLDTQLAALRARWGLEGSDGAR